MQISEKKTTNAQLAYRKKITVFEKLTEHSAMFLQHRIWHSQILKEQQQQKTLKKKLTKKKTTSKQKKRKQLKKQTRQKQVRHCNSFQKISLNAFPL